MKQNTIREGNKTRILLKYELDEIIAGLLVLFIFLGIPFAVIFYLTFWGSMSYNFGIPLMIILALGFFLAWFSYWDKGDIKIDANKRSLTIAGKLPLIGSKEEILVDKNDKIILIREWELKFSKYKGDTDDRQRKRAYERTKELYRKFYDEMKNITHKEVDYDGYVTSVPRDDLTDEEKNQVQKLKTILAKIRTGGSATKRKLLNQLDLSLPVNDFGSISVQYPLVRVVVSHRSEWSVIYRQSKDNNDITLFSASGHKSKVEINNFAEELAEELGLVLIDDTGSYPRILEPGTTDKKLVDNISSDDPSSATLNSDTLSNERIEIIDHGNEIEIKTIHDEFNKADSTRIVLGSIFGIIFGIIDLALLRGLFLLLINRFTGENTWGDVFGFGFVLLFFMLWISLGLYFSFTYVNNSKEIDTIKIANNKVITERSWLLTSEINEISKNDIEKILVVDMGDTYGVEVVGDEAAIFLGEGYDLEKATLFRDAVRNRVIN